MGYPAACDSGSNVSIQCQSTQAWLSTLFMDPSGCGKSTLLRAGILPRLSSDVHTIYLEADPVRTEARLRDAIQRDLSSDLTSGVGAAPGNSFSDRRTPAASLTELLCRLRCGQYRLGRSKLLIVLDQFEAMAVAWDSLSPAELIDALRHCDGGNVQCVLLVRDDYWLDYPLYAGTRDSECRES